MEEKKMLIIYHQIRRDQEYKYEMRECSTLSALLQKTRNFIIDGYQYMIYINWEWGS